MAVPLDQQFKIQKKGIIEERVPVLHPSGMEQHYFVTYIPLPTNIEDGAGIEQWIERMTFISDDLTWLLQQNHPKFWCEAAFNKDFHSMLDSYLRYAPRPQRTVSLNTYSFISNGKQLEANISRLMFMCILRLSTHKESAENFFTPQGFGQIIYDNYIFDIPRLFDICSLYAINNKDLLTKMIGNIFKQQQGYNKDLQHAIQSIQDVITNRIKTFHTQTGPKKLNTTSTKSSSIGEMIDFLYYILDLSCTINRLFSVYPEGRLIFFNEHFHLTLINLFETFLRVYERTRQSNELPDDIEIFEETKYETIFLFNDLLASCCIDPLLINEDKSEHVESLINIFSLLITEKRFLAAYEDYFNLSEIIEIVHQTTGLLDDQQMKFYTDGVKEAIEHHGTPSCKRKLTSSSKASASAISSVKKSTNPGVQMIQDLFPHLNEKYIEMCLNHYNNNTDRLVNALFDNTVPENLQFDNSSTPITTASVENEYEKAFINEDLSIVEQRSNIYDNDEFDIFNQENIDLTRIHRGKKTRDTLAELDDKSHLIGMNERYSYLGLVEDETDGEYDDEYDDTYDDGIVNVRDKDDAIDNELQKNENRLIGKQPGRYRQPAKEDDEDDDDDETTRKARNQFAQNPEVVRERWAQQRAAWQQRHQPQQSHSNQPRDVVGSARGRGQSTTVAHNRRLKDANKSSQGNHNRRNRAAQKANRGLLS